MSRNDFAPMDIPRTHENCINTYGVARPGKTKSDKKNGSWMSKQQRNARHALHDPNHPDHPRN